MEPLTATSSEIEGALVAEFAIQDRKREQEVLPERSRIGEACAQSSRHADRYTEERWKKGDR